MHCCILYELILFSVTIMAVLFSVLPPVWPTVTTSLLKAVEDFDSQLSAGGRSPQLVKAVDSRLRKQTQELHLRCSKVRHHRRVLIMLRFVVPSSLPPPLSIVSLSSLPLLFPLSFLLPPLSLPSLSISPSSAPIADGPL